MFLFIFESIGTQELILIGIVALIFLGPRKLPEIAKTIGKYMAEFRNTTNEFKATWERDPNLYYEDGFQEYANRGGEVRAATIGEVSWVEVDNHEDLAKARDIACRY